MHPQLEMFKNMDGDPAGIVDQVRDMQNVVLAGHPLIGDGIDAAIAMILTTASDLPEAIANAQYVTRELERFTANLAAMRCPRTAGPVHDTLRSRTC
jgi:hypothetical protein